MMDCFVIGFLLYSGLWTPGMAQKEYHFVTEKMNWADAQQHCREQYTDLATIDSVEDMNMLRTKHAGPAKNGSDEDMNMLRNKHGSDGDKNSSGEVWIGYHVRWQWSLSDIHFYREGETSYRNWAENEPNNYKGTEEKCALLGREGKWYDGKCKNSLHFICYDEREMPKYILVCEKKDWHEAQRYCRDNHTDLVSVLNNTENDAITGVLPKGEIDVWIGLFRGAWRWSDQTNPSFTYWRAGEPNNNGGKEDCAVVRFDKEGKWDDRQCDGKHSSLCYDDELVLVAENYTWVEALEYCRHKYGDLVTISSKKLQRLVSRRARGATTRHLWLGLSYTCMLDWFWVSEESLCFQHWAPGFGGERGDCGEAGALDTAGGHQWVSRPVTDRLNFICEK